MTDIREMKSGKIRRFAQLFKDIHDCIKRLLARKISKRTIKVHKKVRKWIRIEEHK